MEKIDDLIDEFQGINLVAVIQLKMSCKIDLDDFDFEVYEFLGVDLGGFDLDVEEYEYMNKRMQDISVVEVRTGKDIEWIMWERVTIARKTTRKRRLQRYQNYENFPQSSPLEKHLESLLDGFTNTRVSISIVKDKLLVGGGL
ncbi:hypothetical protein H5410_004449 [Solanum commersonii]|uniref:Uncharacterized protein n=1 Tax=Solanum commersonii TaxID=4109 RepID=A0A9J6B848_SOLCO|nr:hypothetical protein H5410_004449 [Solanum commersonii]